MKSSKQVQEIRKKLLNKEEKLWSELDQNTVDLEKQVYTLLKTAGVVGASVLAGYLVYRLIAGDQGSKKKKYKPQKTSKVGQSLISMAVKSVLPIAIEKINEQIQTQKNNVSTSKTRAK